MLEVYPKSVPSAPKTPENSHVFSLSFQNLQANTTCLYVQVYNYIYIHMYEKKNENQYKKEKEKMKKKENLGATFHLLFHNAHSYSNLFMNLHLSLRTCLFLPRFAKS